MNRQQEQELLEALRQAIIDGNKQEAEEQAKKAIKEDIDLLRAMERGFGEGIKFVGDSFGNGTMYLPEMIAAADAMQVGNKILLDEINNRGIDKKTAGKYVIGTAEGDIHIIGKSLVATMLTINGFDVVDIGEDKSAESFMEAVRVHDPDIIGISVLLTTAMETVPDVIQALSEANLRSQIKVMVGGGPVTEEWAKEIGADAYGVNAYEAVEKARFLMGPEEQGKGE